MLGDGCGEYSQKHTLDAVDQSWILLLQFFHFLNQKITGVS
ncbi:hypothetical protein T12_5481 [Trichinella patagoniensis]|uniref:Uncharacterized protein n=1 Tax=Trichinella patagoniensis TaxID=990121 RepID=A0A0V0YFX1_9BILA|nr:hypothetical protein T12_5481 [Trichinella patagoniensis]